jgi:hypothetical protein
VEDCVSAKHLTTLPFQVPQAAGVPGVPVHGAQVGGQTRCQVRQWRLEPTVQGRAGAQGWNFSIFNDAGWQAL